MRTAQVLFASPTEVIGGQVPGEVFISYSHDSADHIHRVLELSNRLRNDGVDSVIDQYEDSPAEGWPQWMDRKLRDAEYVLLVCTERYYKRVIGDDVPGTGLGVRWEGHLVYQYFYDDGTLNTRFIPVLFDELDAPYIPKPFAGSTRYVLDVEAGYESLLSRLMGVPKVEKPPLGERQPLAPKPVKTDPTMYVTGPIDFALWNRAQWSGAFYMWSDGFDPVLGLSFGDEDAAREIFETWHERYGPSDLFEELRISIVEGDIPGCAPGYSIQVGTHPEAFKQRLRESGFEYDQDLLVMISRVHRMNPPDDSVNLAMFKQHYAEQKRYILAPGVMVRGGGPLTPLPDLGIRKGVVHFRRVEDIGSDDLDQAVLLTDPDE